MECESCQQREAEVKIEMPEGEGAITQQVCRECAALAQHVLENRFYGSVVE